MNDIPDLPLVGRALAFQEVVSRLPNLAGADHVVLITGETGTGKELVARAIHRLSARAAGPFVAVGGGSLVDTLLESELFGHIGHAAGGTLFLDEAETLTLRGQMALLRVLQERTFRPVGSTLDERVDVRFMAATHVQLDRLVQGGQFRADLYYRLHVFSITLPPLREQRDDIVPLAEHFLGKHAAQSGRRAELSPGAREAMLAFDWPGNVRELESAVVRAVHMATDGIIEPGDLGLPGALLPYKAEKRRILDAFDREYLTRLMSRFGGNVTRAAQAAGKERRDLGKLLKRHGFDPRKFAA
jgi:two-component system response regulator GlrR